MGVFVSDRVRNQGLNSLESSVDRILLVVGEPTTYANVTTNHGTGSGQLAVAASVTSSDFTVEDITGGRRIVAAAQNDNTPVVNANGVNHWCWVDDGDDEIEAYGELDAAIDVTTSGDVDIAAHGVRMPAAVAHS